MDQEPIVNRPVPVHIAFIKTVAGSFKRASASAVVLSLVVHAILWMIAAFVVVGHSGNNDGAAGTGDPGPVEMAVVTEGELSKLQDQALGLATPSVPDSAIKDVDVKTNIPDAGPSEVNGAETVGGIGTLTGGGDVGLGGDGAGLGGTGGGGATFFGIEAQGNRFAYLIDISGSMQTQMLEETRITILKKELNRSIASLSENTQFTIVTFSTGAEPLTGKKEWTEASSAGKKKIQALIGPIFPDGSTNPLPGFQILFDMKPRPDAIYFMTDGQFEPVVVEEVARLNAKSKIPIHCICLGSPEGEEHMRKISKGSKGTFTFIGGPP